MSDHDKDRFHTVSRSLRSDVATINCGVRRQKYATFGNACPGCDASLKLKARENR